MTGKLAILFVTAAGLAAPLFAESGNSRLIEVTNTQTLPFQAGGAIYVDRSYGELSLEGWDRPEVEITVTKSPDRLYDAKDQAEASRRAENVHVTAERRSDTEIRIATSVSHFSRWTHPFGPMGGIVLYYRIRVPRNSKLVIHHENGEVMVSNVTADIEATGRAGDIVLLLPEPDKYSIDAKSKFGTLSCDFDGDFRHNLTGSRYTQTAPAPAHRIFLREGRGGISIKGSPAEAQPPAAAGLQ
jgi:hypothetical protein